ncbi:hypothetical protein [Sphingomonas humi]|uniref:Uncharacterized protein n=1 Tax=Sphingomonas humi TaxID=335630 RepID=A0ABP7RYD4_9SPHN
MRYFEIIESAEQSAAQRAQQKQRNARDRIAHAHEKRSAAATRYQDQLKACDDAIKQAQASLREASVRSYALRDRKGQLLGWIEPQGRLIQGKDRAGTVVGWYDARQNVTRDRHGVLFGTGDLLSALIVCKR